MKKVYQTIVNTTNGNCMQASVASILDLELDQVPKFVEMADDEWCLGIIDFMELHGFTYKGYCSDIYHDSFAMADLPNFTGIDGYFLTSGKSPRFNCGHMTVYKLEEDGSFNLAHDPHESGLGILDISDVLIFEKD